MRKRITIPETIEDLPRAEDIEPKRDFHARFPDSLCKKLEQASKTTGYLRNDIVKKALEAFLK